MIKLNLKGVSTIVWTRSIVTLIAAINVILGYLGIKLIPVTEGDVSALVDSAVVILTAVVWAWGWWKNNSFTSLAQAADVIKKEMLVGAEFPMSSDTIDPDAMGFRGTEGIPSDFEPAEEEAE